MFLAKSYPKRETIVEHTENLINNLEQLKKIYGSQININWDLLELACLYHDLGKVNRVFQKKINKEYLAGEYPDIPHAYLSILFLNYEELLKNYKLEINDIVILINIVAYHHKRQALDEDMLENIKGYIKYLKEDIEGFRYERLDNLGENINEFSLELVSRTGILGLPLELLEDYILLKGLLNKIDYAASGHYKIEYPNNFLVESLEKAKENWGKNAKYNALQNYMSENREENIIAIAETGYGKTEAGLLWIGNNKGFFTLPLKSAINQIYERIVSNIVTEDIERRIGLLHSDTLSEYLQRNKNELNQEILDYQEITNELSMPLTICTIDQIFDFVYKYIGFERKLATLSYSKIVIDEIQMYSADLVAYIIIALEQINRQGGRFAIITATFPPFIKDLLLENHIKVETPDPFLHQNRIRHSIKLEQEELKSEYIYRKLDDNKVLVIVNTVKKLFELYQELAEKEELAGKINLFHSGFTQEDRMEKEKEIMDFGKKENKKTGIWLCTQVAEASLDIDFDILITELSDLSGLFQRMGRCHRKRELETDYNVFVFDGGEKTTSGIGYVNDRDIYEMSKKALRNLQNGKISESEKIDLINKVYSTESLKNTKYYQEILETINYINSINYDEFKKKDVEKYFRNINSINVIPKPIYEEKKEKIEKIIKILSPDLEKTTDKEKNFLARKKARLELEKYKLSIAHYLVNERNIEIIKINEYEYLNIYSCEYSSSYGIKHIEEDKDNEESDMFF